MKVKLQIKIKNACYFSFQSHLFPFSINIVVENWIKQITGK